MLPDDILIVGLPAMAVIVAVVQLIKHYGLDDRWAPLASILTGLVIAVGNQVVELYPASESWYVAIWTGIILGLMASGFYDVANKLAVRE